MADDTRLTIIDKIKLLLGAKQVATDVAAALPSDPNKPSIWTKIDGTKSITGLLLIIAYYALPQFGIKVPEIFLKIGITWAGIGFAHKFDKATSILTAVYTALVKTNDTINGDKK